MGLDQYKVERDEQGNLKPIEAKSINLGVLLEIIPVSYGQSRSMDSFGKPLAEWSTKDIARIFSENVRMVDEEEVGDVSPEDIPDLEAFFVNDIVESVLVNSAMDRLFRKKEEGDQGNAEEPVEEAGESQ